MLTAGNKKLGTDLIWGFALPSGRAEICVGMTPTCRKHCYSRRTEQYRLKAKARYEANLRLTRRRDFARRVRAFLIAHHVRVVRIHTGGEFYSAKYARKWLKIIRRSTRVKFFTYSRAWRVPVIREVLEAMSAEPNCQMWYSLDTDSSVPDIVHTDVRLAWLMTAEDVSPPADVDLVFRVRAQRRYPLAVLDNSPVCRAENGLSQEPQMTCDRCRICWKPPRQPLQTTPS